MGDILSRYRDQYPNPLQNTILMSEIQSLEQNITKIDMILDTLNNKCDKLLLKTINIDTTIYTLINKYNKNNTNPVSYQVINSDDITISCKHDNSSDDMWDYYDLQ